MNKDLPAAHESGYSAWVSPRTTLPPSRRIGRADGAVLAEALATLALCSLAIRLLPFERVARIASLRPEARSLQEEARFDKIRWAVDAWARRVPWRTVCFQRGLSIHLMLRRRGVNSILHYGVSQKPQAGLSAHVWVSVGERILVGGAEAPDFTRLASFPAPLRY